MDIKATLHPGQNGTKELQAKYGDQLVCVRYRYDKIRKKRFKTIELIIDEKEWIPSPGEPASKQKFYLNIAARETNLRNKIKTVGGTWVPSENAWTLAWENIVELGLESRIKSPKET